MNLSTTLRDYFQRFKAHLSGCALPRMPMAEELPLRAELFSAQQMEQHGKALAAVHQLDPGHAPDQLLARLAENENILVEVCNLLTASITDNHRITPAGEWLLDNFYLIEEQIRTAKRHLPKGYSRELPRLDNGPSSSWAGRPRVYDIALEIISHGDGRVDTGVLSRFLTAYQPSPHSSSVSCGPLRSCCGWRSSRICAVSGCDSHPGGAKEILPIPGLTGSPKSQKPIQRT